VGGKINRTRVFTRGEKTTLPVVMLCGLVIQALIIGRSCMDAAPVAEWFRWVEAPHVFEFER
jgi:hypothetical protein